MSCTWGPLAKDPALLSGGIPVVTGCGGFRGVGLGGRLKLGALGTLTRLFSAPLFLAAGEGDGGCGILNSPWAPLPAVAGTIISVPQAEQLPAWEPRHVPQRNEGSVCMWSSACVYRVTICL